MSWRGGGRQQIANRDGAVPRIHFAVDFAEQGNGFAQQRAITKKARKTNHIERFNNTLRQRVSRLVRETLSFSKKLTNHIGAIKYFICHYKLTRRGALPV